MIRLWVLFFCVLCNASVCGRAAEWRPYNQPSSIQDALRTGDKVIVPYPYEARSFEDASYAGHPRVVIRVTYDLEGKPFDLIRAEKTAEVIRLLKAKAISDVTVFFRLKGIHHWMETSTGEKFEYPPEHGSVEFSPKGIRTDLLLISLK